MEINITQLIDLLGNDRWWIAQVFLLVLATVSINFIANFLLNKLRHKAGRTSTAWDDALLASAHGPLSTLIWLLGIAFAADIAGQQSQAAVFDLIDPVRRVGIVAIATWFLVRSIKAAEANYIHSQADQEGALDRTTLTAISNLGKISVVITGTLVGIQSMGYSISGVLAFGGIGGIAIGFAAKDMLANLFGSLIIFLDRPFKIGDWIRSPDREIEGTVEQIGWRMTVIRTFSKNPIYVPNSVFSTIAIENPSRMTNRRIHETIGIRYADFNAMERITSEVKAMLMTHPEIDSTLTLMVNFNRYGASSLDFFVYTFTKTTNWVRFHEVKQDVLLKIGQIIENNNAEIAFPTSTVHLQVEPEKT
ncbi:MAG: mechanosensitive ion channel family protein [Sulfurimicrobium sp.]|jgi:MscS family membrane protein|nr:mechanosensitive ion channel family protein [Sulfurimicrobium sp.]MDZ7657534.1 mechanosensitive ion channel family protein [Sulfurimicrobium sp.]